MLPPARVSSCAYCASRAPVVEVVETDGEIVEGLPRGAPEPLQRLREHHVRLQQLLHLLHRALCPRPGALTRAGGRARGGASACVDAGRAGDHAAGTERQLLSRRRRGVRRICSIASTGWAMPRIRFMTSHPKDLSDELIAAYGELKHLMPHLHLPVQAGDDEILRRMNRRYNRRTLSRPGAPSARRAAGHRPDHGHHRGLPGRDRGAVRAHAVAGATRCATIRRTRSSIRPAWARRRPHMPDDTPARGEVPAHPDASSHMQQAITSEILTAHGRDQRRNGAGGERLRARRGLGRRQNAARALMVNFPGGELS